MDPEDYCAHELQKQVDRDLLRMRAKKPKVYSFPEPMTEGSRFTNSDGKLSIFKSLNALMGQGKPLTEAEKREMQELLTGEPGSILTGIRVPSQFWGKDCREFVECAKRHTPPLKDYLGIQVVVDPGLPENVVLCVGQRGEVMQVMYLIKDAPAPAIDGNGHGFSY